MAYRLGIIGTGQISEAHLNGVRRYNEQYGDDPIHISAVVDTFPGRASKWRERLFANEQNRPEVLEEYHELLQGPHRPDMVSILLPHHLHLEVGRKFLEAGIAVQMQKPIGLAIRDSRELIDIAKRTGTPLVVSEPSVLGRFGRLIIDWIHSGRQIGRPTFMIDQAVIDLKGSFFMTPWRHLKGMAGAGWFIDHGVHRTHWMLEALGPVDHVYAETRQVEPVRSNERWGSVEVDTEDLAAAVLSFASGAVCQWTVMSGGRGQGHGHVQVWGTKGSFSGGKCVLSGEKDSRDLELDNGSVPTDIPGDPFAHSYYELICLMKDPSYALVGDPGKALEAEAIVYACLEAAHTGTVVRVEDVVNCKVDAYEQTVWAARDKALAMDMNRLT